MRYLTTGCWISFLRLDLLSTVWFKTRKALRKVRMVRQWQEDDFNQVEKLFNVFQIFSKHFLQNFQND